MNQMEENIKTFNLVHLEENGMSFYIVPNVKRKSGLVRQANVKCAVNRYAISVSIKLVYYSAKNIAVTATKTKVNTIQFSRKMYA